MLVSVNVAVPLFVKVTLCAALVVPGTCVKVNDVGLIVSPGAEAAPLRATVCGDPLALSVIVIVAVKFPLDAGVNAIENEHEAPAATVAPQLFVSAKLAAFPPPSTMLVIESEPVPVLVNVTVWAVLVAPASALKLSDVALRVTAGAGLVVVPPPPPPLF